jgi:hypothetical protein
MKLLMIEHQSTIRWLLGNVMEFIKKYLDQRPVATLNIGCTGSCEGSSTPFGIVSYSSPVIVYDHAASFEITSVDIVSVDRYQELENRIREMETLIGRLTAEVNDGNNR